MEPELAQQGRGFEAECERARVHADRAREAVREGLDFYLAHLHHALPEVRQAAAALLCAFPEDAPRVLPALAAQIEAEDEADVKSGLVQSLGLLLEALPVTVRSPYVELLEDLER